MREIQAKPIRAVERSLHVLETFTSSDKGALTLTDIAEASGLPRSTVYRILCTLERERYLNYDETKETYSPGIRFIELGVRLTSSLDIMEAAEEPLLELHTETRQTIVMALGDEETIVYAFIKENEEGLKFSSKVGQRRPYTYGVLGITLLAFETEEKTDRILKNGLSPRTPYTVISEPDMRSRLAGVREKGYFMEKDETTVGVSGIGAPILNGRGRPAAAIGIVGPSVQLRGTSLLFAQKKILEKAETIARRMNYQGRNYVLWQKEVERLAGSEESQT
ncbi:IclR family transcriptional regulator [Alkalicoccus chagannorensis]|uniref:IclR family transcriptional regulator n=1 Tax=Alkalicoccus chagannorensis TaxID=427072 RepID=UPI00040F1AEC|nr:IclR family transcriptional regulator [Alkalicoccus chagannorensis]